LHSLNNFIYYKIYDVTVSLVREINTLIVKFVLLRNTMYI